MKKELKQIKQGLESLCQPALFYTKEIYDEEERIAFSGSQILLFFSLVDTVAFLWRNPVKGKAEMANSVLFMRKYFGRVNKKYKKLSGLLYVIYRHGMVHTLRPRNIKLTNGRTVKWEMHLGGSKYIRPHLEMINDRLVINTTQLMVDFLNACSFFWKDIKKKNIRQRKFLAAFRKLKRPLDEISMLRKPYIKPQDFIFLDAMKKHVLP